jgi:hypothetical protein
MTESDGTRVEIALNESHVAPYEEPNGPAQAAEVAVRLSKM